MHGDRLLSVFKRVPKLVGHDPILGRDPHNTKKNTFLVHIDRMLSVEIGS